LCGQGKCRGGADTAAPPAKPTSPGIAVIRPPRRPAKRRLLLWGTLLKKQRRKAWKMKNEKIKMKNLGK
jgi:hypothetical protein